MGLNNLSKNLMESLREASNIEVNKKVFMENTGVRVEEGVLENIPGTDAQIAKARKESKEKGLLTEDKEELEDRLASLKMQLEVDGAQLASDEVEAIENEIAELELKLQDIEIMGESSINESYNKEDFSDEWNKFIEAYFNGEYDEAAKIVKTMEYDDIFTLIELIDYNKVDKNFSLNESCNKKLKESSGRYKYSNHTYAVGFKGSAYIHQGNQDAANETLKNLIESIKSSNIEEIEVETFNNDSEDTAGNGLSESKKICEAEVKNIKPIKQQGNIFMLEDENKQVIVGENYDEKEGLIENAEIYDNKEEADKDYLGRCKITKDGKSINESYEPESYEPGRAGRYNVKAKVWDSYQENFTMEKYVAYIDKDHTRFFEYNLCTPMLEKYDIPEDEDFRVEIMSYCKISE